MKLQCVTIQMKAIERFFHVVLFIMLYEVVLTYNSVDETLECYYLNENFLSCDDFTVKSPGGGSDSEVHR